jgi:alpha-L-fucosidase
MKVFLLICFVLSLVFTMGCAKQEVQQYEPTWSSVSRHLTPQWLRDGKFGIYTHWGPYAVHAYGSNTTWYSNALYMRANSPAREHFEKTFGPLTPEFGYKDLIPKFTAEKFNADEWAELFQTAGAMFAGPVAEHHDGFAMWDTKYSEWNAAKMGPKRDVVREFELAVKKRGMKFVTAFHHAANWFFFPVWDKQYDTGDPKNSGLYGQYHEQGAMRNQEFLDEWYGKIIEVIDNYSPDFIWYDFALDEIPEGYVKDFLAYYYNHALKENKEVVVTYKGNDLIPGSGVRDLELGQAPSITYHDWITDTSVDDRGAWGWAEDLIFKSPNRLIDNLVDRVSKNGYLLLNVGPKPDGTIPEPAREALLEMGSWLKTNGEAIYGTTPWFIAAEGPTNLGAETAIGFNESNVNYTSKDIRFTTKGDDLYATFLDWPGEKAMIQTIRQENLEPEAADEIDPSMSLAGTTWNMEQMNSKVKYVFKKDGNFRVSGGTAGEGVDGKYEQADQDVYLSVGTFTWQGRYDGKEFTVVEGSRPRYPGFYKEEIKRISMLGDGKDLNWKMTRRGLVIETPEQKPTEHAFVFKIERHHYPQID